LQPFVFHQPFSKSHWWWWWWTAIGGGNPFLFRRFGWCHSGSLPKFRQFRQFHSPKVSSRFWQQLLAVLLLLLLPQQTFSGKKILLS
jgi:hypothetical protein